MNIILNMVSGVFKLTSVLLRYWLLIVLAAIALSPIGPHLRWQYQYLGPYSNKTFIRCDYIGSRGVVEDVPHLTPDCPFFVILDSREYRR